MQLIKHLGTIMRESVQSNGDVVQKTIHFFLAYALKTTILYSYISYSPKSAGLNPEAIELVPYEAYLGLYAEVHLSPSVHILNFQFNVWSEQECRGSSPLAGFGVSPNTSLTRRRQRVINEFEKFLKAL